MPKRCLILFSSFTGNTEKVAIRFRDTFIRHGWSCDLFKVQKRAKDILDPPFFLETYDFLCVGSGIRLHLPYNEILNLLRRLIYGVDPRIPLQFRDETIPYIQGPVPEAPPPWEDPQLAGKHRKIVLGPDSRKAVVFVTYAGYEFGPKEAEPALKLLALEVEHLGFQCIGHFCCPGRYYPYPTPYTYHGDITDRPNEKDLLKAELFIEERLEEIREMGR